MKFQNVIKMKKLFLVLSISFFLTSVYNTLHAQADVNTEAMAYVEFDEVGNHSNTYDSRSNPEGTELDRLVKAKAYDRYVSKEFGSYLNPYNGTLNIVNNKNTIFNKAQLQRKSTKKNIFSISLTEETKSIDISNLKAGEYILFLSNDDGNIQVENFIII